MPQFPFGNAFIAATPEIDKAEDQIWQAQQMRRAWQMREAMTQGNQISREFSKIRGADVPLVTGLYQKSKALKQQLLFNPSIQNDPDKFAQVSAASDQALSDVYSAIDKSVAMKQQLQSMDMARRNPKTAALFEDNYGEKRAFAEKTPLDKMDQTPYGDLTNVDNWKTKSQIDFSKLDKNAYGTEKESGYEDVPINGGLQTQRNYFQYGNNPALYRDVLIKQLAVNPRGEKESAAGLAMFSPEQVAEINRQYYAPNPQKWNQATGQPNPINVEPRNPDSEAEQYASLLAKQRFLMATPRPSGRSEIITDKNAVMNKQEGNQLQLQQNRFKQQELMEKYRQGDAVSRIQLRRNYQLQDESGKAQTVNDAFDTEFNSAKAGQQLTLPTQSGGQVSGYPSNTSPIIANQFAAYDDKGHKMLPDKIVISPDGKTYTGVFTTTNKDGKTVVDESKTKQISTEELKPILRKDLEGTPKHYGPPKPPAAPKPTVTVSHEKGVLN